MNRDEYIHTDFEKVFSLYGVNHIGTEFVMIDNLSQEHAIDGSEKAFYHYPIKITNNTTLFCVGGSMTVKYNLNEHQVVKNDALTMQPGSIMELIELSDDIRIAIISFSDKYFIPFDHMEEFIGIRNHIYLNPLISISDEMMQECIEIYLKMKSKLEQENNPFRQFALKAYSYVLCSTALEHLANRPEEKIPCRDRAMDLYNRFTDLLRRDFRQHRSIAYYAQTLNISPKYFSRLIKRVSGRTAGEWIDDYVMLEARALLKSRRYTVQQISDMLSFSNQSFFAKYFKAHQGCTPSRYQAGD